MDQAASDERVFKLNDQQIKKYRELLTSSDVNSKPDAWERFCDALLRPYISVAWDDIITDLNIQFVGTRGIESREHFDRDPNWNDMTDIIGRFGTGSTDARIINFFLCSKFPVIVTGDEDVAFTVERLSEGKKYVLVKEASRDACIPEKELSTSPEVTRMRNFPGKKRRLSARKD